MANKTLADVIAEQVEVARLPDGALSCQGSAEGTLTPLSPVSDASRAGSSRQAPKPLARMFGYSDPESDGVVQTLSNN